MVFGYPKLMTHAEIDKAVEKLLLHNAFIVYFLPSTYPNYNNSFLFKTNDP